MSKPKNPWKDFASYNTDDARFFKGREESIAKFMRVIDAGTMSVLYASSGIGKTSFLQAGIEPLMIPKGYAPIHILFTDDDFMPQTDLRVILGRHIYDEVDKHNKKEYEKKKEEEKSNRVYEPNTWKWHCIIDKPSESKVKLLDPEIDEHSLWWKLHAYEIKDINGRALRPLFVFDQFEEVFVKAKAQRNLLQNLFKTFEEIASNNLPHEIETMLNQLADEDYFPDLDTRHRYKCIFSLRKEYLSDFDFWTNDRHSIAELQQNRMLLLPLSRTQATKVITEQPLNHDGSKYFTTLNSIANDILNVIDDSKRNEIEPFILSVLCSRLYERARKLGRTELRPEDLNEYSANTIIREFYEQKVHTIISKQSHLKRFEEELVDDDGKRCRTKVKRLNDIDFEKRYRKSLVDAHLVRIDCYNDEEYIELVHDRVADAIMERQQESTKKNKLIFARFVSFIAIFALFFITYWIQTIPTSNKVFPYQLKSVYDNKRYINYTGDTIHGQEIEAINCRNLDTIIIDSCFSARIKVRGCNELRNISLNDNCRNVNFDLDCCPKLNPIKIPSSVWSITFENIPPNNLTFQTEKSGRYIWKDNILWDKQDTTIMYARYDAPASITPPIKTSKINFTYQIQSFNNIEPDTITLTGYDSKHEIKDSIRVSRYCDRLDLHTFKISYTSNWDMSKFPNLCEIILPDSLVGISERSFAGCVKLRHVTFPSSLRRIGAEVFWRCSSLQEINLPTSLDYIGRFAFYGCTSLTEVNLPDSVSVDLSSFDRCSNLKTIKLPHFFKPYFSNDYLSFMFKDCPNISKFYIDKSSNNYAVEDDSTIVYTGYKINNAIIPLLFLNTVRKHSYNSEEFVIDNSIPPYSFYSKNGALYCKNKNGSILINDPANNIYQNTLIIDIPKGTKAVYVPLTNRDVLLTGSLDGCKEVHFPYVEESKRITIDFPSELKRKTILYVPYGALSYFIGSGSFDASEWKGIEEENFFPWLCIIIKYHLNTGLEVVGQWGWFWPIIIIAVLFTAAIITYLYRRKETMNRTKRNNMAKFFANFIITLVWGVFTWYTFYWFLFLSTHQLWKYPRIIEMAVEAVYALVSACLAIIFVYVVLYSKGFSLRGFMISCRSNYHALRSGLEDVFITFRHLSWQSIAKFSKEMIVKVKIAIRNTTIWLLSETNRFLTKTRGSIQYSMYKFAAKPIKTKFLICTPFFATILLFSAYHIMERLNQDQIRDNIINYCRLIVEADTINSKQIVDLHDKLVESIAIKGMKTLYSSAEIETKALNDSIFIVVESDSCLFLDFACMRCGNVNFGHSIQEISNNNFYLSDSQQFIYYTHEGSVYIWPKDSLDQKPFIEKTSSNARCTWFAHDKYVCFENSEGNYVVYDTKTWCDSIEIKREINSNYSLTKVSNGLFIANYSSTNKKSKAFLYDENLKRHTYDFDGKLKICLDNKYIVSQKDDLYLLYNLAGGELLDKRNNSTEFVFYSDYLYGYKSYNNSDSILIFKVIDKHIVFDIIPFKMERSFGKYICCRQNDSTIIYHIPTDRKYNLGYSTSFSCNDSLVSSSANGQITVYNFADSMKVLGRIPFTSYSVYMNNFNNYLTFDNTNGLFRYNADSLWQISTTDFNINFSGWYCYNYITKEYYSLDNFNEGSYKIISELKSNILRGGWCFVTSDKGFVIKNIKSLKLLIKESNYIDNQLKEQLYKLIDKHNSKKIQI